MNRTEEEVRAHAKKNHGAKSPAGKSRFYDETQIDGLIDETKKSTIVFDDDPNIGVRSRFKRFKNVGRIGATGKSTDWVRVIENMKTGATQTAFPDHPPKR